MVFCLIGRWQDRTMKSLSQIYTNSQRGGFHRLLFPLLLQGTRYQTFVRGEHNGNRRLSHLI